MRRRFAAEYMFVTDPGTHARLRDGAGVWQPDGPATAFLLLSIGDMCCYCQVYRDNSGNVESESGDGGGCREKDLVDATRLFNVLFGFVDAPLTRERFSFIGLVVIMGFRFPSDFTHFLHISFVLSSESLTANPSESQ